MPAPAPSAPAPAPPRVAWDLEQEDDSGERTSLSGRRPKDSEKATKVIRERIRREYADLYRTTWSCCCSWRCGCCLFFLAFMGTFVTLMWAAISVVNMYSGALAAILIAQPTMGDALRREAALLDAGQNWCDLPIKMLVVPPSCGRLVMVALNGTGGEDLRYRLELATRITTSIPQCFHGLQFKSKLDPSRPIFRGDCTGMAYSANHFLVSYSDWDRAVATPHYEPTKAVFLLRNPLEAAVAAFAELVACGDPAAGEQPHSIRARSADCQGTVLPQDYHTGIWRNFAMDYTDAFLDSINDTRKALVALGPANVRVIYYEDVVQNRPTAELRELLEFARPIFGSNLPDAKRMMRCADAAADAPAALPPGVGWHSAFADEELMGRFCERLRSVWSEEKWGSQCL